MLIKCFPVGVIQANCYIVSDERTMECAVIDPGADSNTIIRYLENNGLKCKFIFLTHGHFDHTGAVEALQEETKAVVCVSAKEIAKKPLECTYKFKAPANGVNFCSDGDSFNIGSLVIEVIETPGHSEGGLTFRCEDTLFTGDTLFRNSIGRTDLPGCSYDKMMTSLLKLYRLEGDYEVYPGHMEATTLERERRHNLYMQDALRSAE